MSLESALFVDAATVAVAFAVLLSRPGASFLHPGVLYTFLHLYMVTLRGWAVEAGGSTFMNVPVDAFPKVILMADLALLTAVYGWSLVSGKGDVDSDSAVRRAVVPKSIVHRVAVVSVPVGLVSLATTGFLPGAGSSEAVITTSYQTIAVLWPALIGVALVYVHGFRVVILVPLAGYLLVLALQGHSRFRFAIPVIMLVLIFLYQKGLRWPPLRLSIVLLFLIAVFNPLKSIGLEVREGTATWESVRASITESSRETSRGENSEQALLDQFAIAVLVADTKGAVFMGKPYAALILLPIPRPLWDEKPGLAEQFMELQSSRYPIAKAGAITTLPGDLYLNFRWFGVLIGSFVLALASGTVYRRAMAAPTGSAYMFGYILLAGILVQIARDGLVSLVLFTLVNATPWVATWLLSVRKERLKRMKSYRGRRVEFS